MNFDEHWGHSSSPPPDESKIASEKKFFLVFGSSIGAFGKVQRRFILSLVKHGAAREIGVKLIVKKRKLSTAHRNCVSRESE